MNEFNHSYAHLCALRDEVIARGVIPAIEDWHKINGHLLTKNTESQDE